LEKPERTKVSAAVAAREGGEAIGGERGEGEVAEHLVGDEGEAAVVREALEGLGLVAADEGSGGVVGVDEEDGAGAVVDRALEGVEVDVPAMLAHEGVLDGHDVLGGGEEIEEGIRGCRDEDAVTALAEELEEEAVGLAGAGGEGDAGGVGEEAARGVVGGDGGAGGGVAEGVGDVGGAAGVAEVRDEGRGVEEGGARGVGLGEVGEGDAAGAGVGDGAGEGAGGLVPVGAASEPHEEATLSPTRGGRHGADAWSAGRGTYRGRQDGEGGLEQGALCTASQAHRARPQAAKSSYSPVPCQARLSRPRALRASRQTRPTGARTTSCDGSGSRA
jgi:hypothetical protein